ncbi:MaoC/PaaZ C-terminal domain-containing protein [Klebsiella michiganensis]|uniref:MaoC/PaaZ C-terminal domain-containing protein n=1 Tax=Klebsiella michiganensis TaxID=1134687 RepID=UPI00136AB792|nr:MaoC/PaaZ C-terminal domain-containing protein [Klebsiella michiganensis]MEB8293584.1 hypothetical protein [Klebsiella michiganensis]MXJ84123.1 hypothetical protein [Klebsiella michiganensis]
MMTLCYSLRDAERWAAFSGDDNPLHFDATEAKRFGLEGLCVHGMRAMLDVKSALSACLESDALTSGDLLFSCRLREPVACEKPYQILVCETRRHEQVQLSGSLLNVQTQRTGISSKLASSKALALSPVVQSYTLGEEALTALYERFLAVQSPAAPLWSFLDAALFRELVNAPETLATVHRIFPQPEVASLRDVFRLAQVVQTHHEVHFSPQLLSQRGESQRIESLYYSIKPTLVMGEKHSGLILVAGIQAWRLNEPLISVTVTLKTGPLAA